MVPVFCDFGFLLLWVLLIFPSVLRPDIISSCLFHLIIVTALTKFSPKELGQLQHCKWYSSSNPEYFTLTWDRLYVRKEEEWDNSCDIFAGWSETLIIWTASLQKAGWTTLGILAGVYSAYSTINVIFHQILITDLMNCASTFPTSYRS